MIYERPQKHREDQSIKRTYLPVDQAYKANYSYNFPHVEVSKATEENTSEILDEIDLALGALAVEAE